MFKFGFGELFLIIFAGMFKINKVIFGVILSIHLLCMNVPPTFILAHFIKLWFVYFQTSLQYCFIPYFTIIFSNHACLTGSHF